MVRLVPTHTLHDRYCGELALELSSNDRKKKRECHRAMALSGARGGCICAEGRIVMHFTSVRPSQTDCVEGKNKWKPGFPTRCCGGSCFNLESPSRASAQPRSIRPLSQSHNSHNFSEEGYNAGCSRPSGSSSKLGWTGEQALVYHLLPTNHVPPCTASSGSRRKRPA